MMTVDQLIEMLRDVRGRVGGGAMVRVLTGNAEDDNLDGQGDGCTFGVQTDGERVYLDVTMEGGTCEV